MNEQEPAEEESDLAHWVKHNVLVPIGGGECDDGCPYCAGDSDGS